MHLVHIFPSLSVMVIFATTDIRIKAGHSKVFPVIGLVFGAVNCYHVKLTGEPTYWFLTWEDYTSALNISIIVAVITAWFIGLAMLTETLKSSKSTSASPVEQQLQLKSPYKKKGCPARFKKK